jgi:Flp pilus assembly protein TadG
VLVVPGHGFHCGHRETRRGVRDERGAAIVEYALVFLIFSAIVFGILGMGQAMYAYHFVSHAAREGARYAAVRGFTCTSDNSCAASNSASGVAGPATGADVQTYVRNMAPTGIDSTKVTATSCGVSGGTACANSTPTICTAAVGTVAAQPNWPGCTTQVQVQYTYNFVVPLVHTGALTLTSSSDLIIVH